MQKVAGSNPVARSIYKKVKKNFRTNALRNFIKIKTQPDLKVEIIAGIN